MFVVSKLINNFNINHGTVLFSYKKILRNMW